jgi:hypothetical protein
MAQWPALYGVFRHDDDQSRLIEGVKAVLGNIHIRCAAAQLVEDLTFTLGQR